VGLALVDAKDAIESLGWVAIGAGVIANLPFNKTKN